MFSCRQRFPVLVIVASLSACTTAVPPRNFTSVKNPGTNALCQTSRVCEIEVLMSMKGGECVYDVAEFVFAFGANDELQWRVKPAAGSNEQYRFPAHQLPVFLKPESKGPPWTGAVPAAPSDRYTVQRATKTPFTTNVYGMRVDYLPSGGKDWKACRPLDPVIISMP